MKIVFINPPSPFEDQPAMNPPLGIMYVSAYLKEHGYIDNHLVDFSVEEYDFNNVPLDGDLYGIYVTTAQFKWAKEIITFLRSRNKLVTVGGPHATALPLDFKNVNLVVVGDGEKLVNALREDIIKEDSGFIALELKNHHKIEYSVIPDWEITDISKYKRKINGEQAAHIITLRGCPYNCHYCCKSGVGRNVKYKPLFLVFKEIDYLRSIYNINSFVIYDDIFTLSNIRLTNLCNGLYERQSKWRCWSRTDTITKDQMELMKFCGLQSITFGVESGSDYILQMINKKATREDNIKALKAAKEVGIPVRCSLMYGNPGENKETLQDTINMIEETQPDEWNLAVLTPVPGSEFWDNPDKYGLKFDKEWLKKFDYEPCNRFGESGVGDIWIEIDSMTKEEFKENLYWFIEELERVCPRKKIQDTIQTIKI